MSTFKFRAYNETEVIISISDLSKLEAENTELKERLNNSKNFHCPHYLTNNSGTVSCHYDMKAQLAKAVNVIEFYANSTNWKTYKRDHLCRLDLVISDDFDSCGELQDNHESLLVGIGGKRARQFLASIKENENE